MNSPTHSSYFVKIATVWFISVSSLGFEYAIYDHTVSYLLSGKEREAEGLMRRPGLKYHHRKSELVCRDLGEKPMVLAKFVRMTRYLPGRDRAGADFLYSRLVEACKGDAGALAEVRSMMGEKEERGRFEGARKALMASLRKAGVDIEEEEEGSDFNNKL